MGYKGGQKKELYTSFALSELLLALLVFNWAICPLNQDYSPAYKTDVIEKPVKANKLCYSEEVRGAFVIWTRLQVTERYSCIFNTHT